MKVVHTKYLGKIKINFGITLASHFSKLLFDTDGVEIKNSENTEFIDVSANELSELFTVQEVERSLSKWKDNKSCGVHFMSIPQTK